MTSTLEKLSLEVDVAQWEWLRAHNDRGALLWVAHGLEMADVGAKMAADDEHAIKAWLDSRELGRPSPEQVAAWELTPQRNFAILIVSPYVLVQESQ